MYGCLAGPPPSDLIASPCRERERDGMHLRRDQVSLFPVLMDQRMCFRISDSLLLLSTPRPFHPWSSKNVDWHATFILNAGISSKVQICPDV